MCLLHRLGGHAPMVAVWGALTLLAACAAPPRGLQTSPPESASPAIEPSRTQVDTTWSVTAEGTIPSVDVAFEEDEVPPAPEDVQGAALARPPVAVETVEDDVLDEEGAPQAGRTLPVAPSVTAPVEGGSTPMTRGFRVQLLASREREEARRVAREAEGRLQVPTYVVYEAPFFKVRAGDFPERSAALALRDRARGYGYPNAWVVTTEIAAGKDG